MAARKGRYRTEVDPLLRRYEMPGSLRDEEGMSILHHVASARTDDQRPLWTHANIENFMRNYNCIPNAVDYQGIFRFNSLVKVTLPKNHMSTECII